MAHPSGNGAGTVLDVLIIDDEPLAHRVLLHHLANHDDMRVVKQCYNAT